MEPTTKKKSILLIFHFFHPDTGVSSTHYTQLAEGLRDRGWDVHVLTSNRLYKDHKLKVPKKLEIWNDITIHRAYTPPLSLKNAFTRLANSFFLIGSFLWKTITLPKYDVILSGTGPNFLALITPYLRLMRKGKILSHWCFDLYPEAIAANSKNPITRLLVKLMSLDMCFAYRFLDHFVDLGHCMKDRLKKYKLKCQQDTLIPWAFEEFEQLQDPDTEIRKKLFGDAKLTILYSGTMGLAHMYENFLALARKLRNENIAFCFAGHGHRMSELKSKVTDEDTNVHFAGFCSLEELPKRLNCADIHALSLLPTWEGIVLPSKFFGSLAVGKPILYDGTENSEIAHWLKEYGIGFTVNENNIDAIAEKLIKYRDDKSSLDSMRQKSLETSQNVFRKDVIIDGWDRILGHLIEPKKLKNS